MNTNGRIIVCGMISDYNASALSPGPNWMNMIRKRLTIKGYAMPDHWRRFPEISDTLAGYLRDGKLKYRAHVIHGLESAIDGRSEEHTSEIQSLMRISYDVLCL